MIFQSRPTTIGAIMVGMNRNGTTIAPEADAAVEDQRAAQAEHELERDRDQHEDGRHQHAVPKAQVAQKRLVVGEPGEVAHLPVTHLVQAQIKDVEERDQAHDHERDHRGRDQEVGVPEAAPSANPCGFAARHAPCPRPRSSSCHGPQAGGRRFRRPRAFTPQACTDRRSRAPPFAPAAWPPRRLSWPSPTCCTRAASASLIS